LQSGWEIIGINIPQMAMDTRELPKVGENKNVFLSPLPSPLCLFILSDELECIL